MNTKEIQNSVHIKSSDFAVFLANLSTAWDTAEISSRDTRGITGVFISGSISEKRDASHLLPIKRHGWLVETMKKIAFIYS